jgi:hypothetical protein
LSSAYAGPVCTSSIVLNTCGIHFAEHVFNQVGLGLNAFIVVVHSLFLVGHLCALVTGYAGLIGAADCHVVCDIYLLFTQVCVIIYAVNLVLWEKRDGQWVHCEMCRVKRQVGGVAWLFHAI